MSAMDYMDEKMIAMLQDAEQEIQGEAESPVVPIIMEELVDLTRPIIRIGDELTPFFRKELPEVKISIILPRSFRLMNRQEASLKYPSEYRPSLIYTNESGTINITFNLVDTPLSDEELEYFTTGMTNILRSVQPIREWKESGIKENQGGVSMGYCQFISTGLNDNLYNDMAFVVVEDRALLCAFNCTEDELNEWAPIARSMMDSLLVADHRGGRRA